MLFVFLALLEFAIVNSYMRKSEKFEQMAKKLQLGIIKKRRFSEFQNLTMRSGSEFEQEKPQTEIITANGVGHPEKKAAFRYIDDTNRTLPTANVFMCKLLRKNWKTHIFSSEACDTTKIE